MRRLRKAKLSNARLDFCSCLASQKRKINAVKGRAFRFLTCKICDWQSRGKSRHHSCNADGEALALLAVLPWLLMIFSARQERHHDMPLLLASTMVGAYDIRLDHLTAAAFKVHLN